MRKLFVIDLSPPPEGGTAAATRGGKFVVLSDGAADYLVLSATKIHPYHANIVERFCGDRGIAGRYFKRPTGFFVTDPRWEVLGGGKWEADDGGRRLLLYDESSAYGRFPDERLGERVAATDPFRGFRVTID